ncbi:MULTISPECIES: TniQ family protein [unclassified Burkholderia]|uniref:TniQ family protein n=1 Tax=unclassified Burkholderia TaxID=2613784 RepID=UPI0019820932|nr:MULTISPECIES: TniQ family protein [unclassified Burkholderia]MBN3769283.1 TniQ family protein [Burkholderia sp. Se-20378]MBN3793995.1 TniQ family protein [Burkholderia sp. Ac-20392]
MTVFLDEPLPDEALFSVVARYLEDAKVTSRSAFQKYPSGSDAGLLTGITRGLDRIATETAMVWGMSVDEIRERLTLYPYYAELCGPKLGETRQGGSAKQPTWLSRATPGRLGMRHCEVCWKEDIAFDIPRYWRRAHQLPGVLTCLLHQCPLNYSGCGAAQSLIESGRRFDVGNSIKPVGSSNQQEARRRFAMLSKNVLTRRKNASQYLERAARIDCARAIGYANGKSVEFRDMMGDLTRLMGCAYFERVGVSLHNDYWIRRAFWRTKSESGSALKYLLLEFLLQENVGRIRRLVTPICPRAASVVDFQHRLLIREIGECESHYICSCGFSFIYFHNCPEGADVLKPTHDGVDLAIAAGYLIARGYSTNKVSHHLSVEKERLENMLRVQHEVGSWRCQRTRAKHLAAWIELVDRYVDANTALTNDRGHWCVVAELARSLPSHLIPSRCAFSKGTENGDLS